MAKRRSCRRTAEEERQHEQAVKIRKMTDDQICRYIETVKSDAYKNGQEDAKFPIKIARQESKKEKTAKEFLDKLVKDRFPGVGAVTIGKILEAAKTYGYLD